MGILGLSKLIADLAPLAIRESEIKNFFGMSVNVSLEVNINKYNLI